MLRSFFSSSWIVDSRLIGSGCMFGQQSVVVVLKPVALSERKREFRLLTSRFPGAAN